MFLRLTSVVFVYRLLAERCSEQATNRPQREVDIKKIDFGYITKPRDPLDQGVYGEIAVFRAIYREENFHVLSSKFPSKVQCNSWF